MFPIIKEILEQNQNKGIRIPQITTLFPDWWRSLNKKKGSYLTAQKGGGDLKDTDRNTQNAALNVDLF